MVVRNEGPVVAPAEAQRRPHRTGAGGYEELTGGQGRAVYFRPERYGADELGPVRPVVRLAAAGEEPRELRLYDVSQNGLAFHWDGPDEPPPLGTVLPRLEVAFDGYTAYDGTARVSSLRGDPGEWLVGVAFLDSLMDVEDVLRLRDVRAWESSRPPHLGVAGRPWHVGGFETFKALVCELRMFLEDAGADFDALEASFPSHLLYRDVDSAAWTGLASLVQTQFVAPFVEQAARIDAALRGASVEERQALREFSRRQVHALLTRSRSLARALHKPLGYPGDYLVIESIYGQGFEGASLFDRAVEHAILSLPAAAAVRSRKDLLRERVRQRLRAEAGRTAPLRVVSVAAGPAREMAELFSTLEDGPPHIEVTLFDQDKTALSFAWGRLQRVLEPRWNGRVAVTYLHDAIRRLLHDPRIFSSFGPFDVVLCAGLFDYLSTETAVSLAAKLLANTAPGGTVWIGNMRPVNPTRWAMELHMEWDLRYRTDEELRDMGRRATGGDRFAIVEEATGINPFLVLERD